MDGRRARCVLGVDPDAGPDEIRRAFRARALVTHPDHGGSAPAFAEVTAAFALLCDAVNAARPRVVPVLPCARPRVDVYDSVRRAPRRDFADVLRAATARLK
jgi:hypothetical protein